MEDNKAFRLGLNNAATARGLMRILLKLAKREALSPQDSDKMIKILLQQKFNEMIPAQLPANVRVAHKTGWNDDLYHNAGIIYPPDGKPFVLVILTRGCKSESDAYALIASLARIICNYWKS